MLRGHAVTRKRNMDTIEFELWLEFEHWESGEGEPEGDFFNMQIALSTGEKYALNVWTYDSIGKAVAEAKETGEGMEGAYLFPPDLFVERMDRALLEEVVADLIDNDELKEEWRLNESDSEE